MGTTLLELRCLKSVEDIREAFLEEIRYLVTFVLAHSWLRHIRQRHSLLRNIRGYATLLLTEV